MQDRAAREAALYLVKAVDHLSNALLIIHAPDKASRAGLAGPSFQIEISLKECRDNLEAAINALNRVNV